MPTKWKVLDPNCKDDTKMAENIISAKEAAVYYCLYLLWVKERCVI